MRSQLMIPDKSAMPERQKFNILSNDLVRRMSSIKVEKAEEGEEQRVIDHFTSQQEQEQRNCGSWYPWMVEEVEEEERTKPQLL